MEAVYRPFIHENELTTTAADNTNYRTMHLIRICDQTIYTDNLDRLTKQTDSINWLNKVLIQAIFTSYLY